jgi:replicative DNA helicase
VNKTTIIEKGELPPQVLEVEDGSWSNDDWQKGVDERYWHFAAWCLYKEAQTYFETIVQLFTETQPIDLLTVSAQLKKNAKSRFGWEIFIWFNLPKKYLLLP